MEKSWTETNLWQLLIQSYKGLVQFIIKQDSLLLNFLEIFKITGNKFFEMCQIT